MGKLQDLIMFTGVGQAGGNIAKAFFDKGYGAYFVNSSLDDLASLQVAKELTFHVPAGTGCAKSLDKAEGYVEQYGDRIVEKRFDSFAQYAYNFYCFGAGGGTGCGMAPSLIRKEKGQLAKMHLNYICNAIVALPSSTESSTAKLNAMHCIEELSQLLEDGLISNLYILDNNKGQGNVFKVNEDIVKRLCQLFDVTNSDVKGVVDTAEIENVLSIVGCVNIADLKPSGEKFIVTPDEYIPKAPRGCDRLVYSIANDGMFCQEHIESVFGRPDDFFKGYSKTDLSTVFAFGMQLPKDYLVHLQEEVVEEKKSAKKKGSFGFKFSMFEEPAQEPAPNEVATQPTGYKQAQQAQEDSGFNEGNFTGNGFGSMN